MWLLGAAALAGGCASRGQLDILESRLRQQDDSITQLQNQLSTTQSQLQAARRESDDLKTQLADGTRTARVEQVSALGQVEGIELNRYLTGGLDRDGVPGDELLSVLIVPNDSQGNLVKAPGAVAVTLFDLSKPEPQQRIGHWEFSPQKSESLWVSGFLGSGYVIRVPWQEQPQSANLLVHARLKTIDGRQFDTSQSIRIVPPTRGGAPQSTVAASSTKQQPEPTPPAVVPASAPTSTVPPDEPVAQKDKATDAAWWDESKQPPSGTKPQ
jgi:outer membrane murein-binding lipoprotein Lpp